MRPLLCGLVLVLTLGHSWAQRPGQRPVIAQGDLAAGDPAPEFSLPTLDGQSSVALSSLRGKPVVLIFGSCTCPPFVAATHPAEALFQTYKDRVHFLLVYIREAHPTDGWVKPGNAFEVASPKTTQERQHIAQEFARRLHLSIPIVTDTTADQVEAAYVAWPNRMLILDAQGTILDAGRAGPDGTASSAKRAPQILDEALRAQ